MFSLIFPLCILSFVLDRFWISHYDYHVLSSMWQWFVGCQVCDNRYIRCQVCDNIIKNFMTMWQMTLCIILNIILNHELLYCFRKRYKEVYKKESWTIASAKALRCFLWALVFFMRILVTRYFEKYSGKFYINNKKSARKI